MQAEDPSSVNIDKFPVARCKMNGEGWSIHYRNAVRMLDGIKPYIKMMQQGESVDFFLDNHCQNGALRAYERAAHGEKRLSTLEREALMLLPGGRGVRLAVSRKLQTVTDEKKRKRMIYEALKRVYNG